MDTKLSNAITEFIDIEAVPSLPSSVQKVMELLDRDNVSVRDVANLIGEDIGLASRVLKLANSVIYSGSSKETASLSNAVNRIGFEETKEICLSIGIASQFKGSCEHVDLVELFKHSLSVAFATEAVLGFCRSSVCKELSADTLYTAGLLHDIGHVVLDRQQPKKYAQVFTEHASSEEKFHHLEQTILGFGHAEVGAMVVGQWGLPDELVKIIEYHHNHEGADEHYRPYTQILHIADCICNQQGYSDSIEGRIEPFDISAWHDLELSDKDIPNIIEQTSSRIQKAELFASLTR